MIKKIFQRLFESSFGGGCRRGRGKYKDWIKGAIFAECAAVAVLSIVLLGRAGEEAESASSHVLSVESDYIKWVDFTVSYEALCKAYEWDVKTHGTDFEVNWVDLLAYTAAKTGGKFEKKSLKILDKAAEEISQGKKTLEEITADMKYFCYYQEAYNAAIGGLVGEYREEVSGGTGNTEYEERYGLKGYFPLARGFDYTHYDDFGVGRSYGYQRKHLGHDMMGLVGTPTRIICRI